MRVKDILASFPERVRARSADPSTVYAKQPGSAVHNRSRGQQPPGADFVLNDSEIAVFKGEPPPAELQSPGAMLTPVYAQQPKGSLAVPTGRIFIRFRDGVTPVMRSSDIRKAGYEIAQTMVYAPHAAWLQVPSGDAAEALQNISKLEQIADVESVEPQMLLNAEPRDGLNG